jgi:hypothetical protein
VECCDGGLLSSDREAKDRRGCHWLLAEAEERLSSFFSFLSKARAIFSIIFIYFRELLLL